MKASAYLLHLLICLTVLSFTPACCQIKSQLNWTTDSESLPQNSIKSIVPDKYGYIWMTTENGLVRYDGQEFKIFDTQNLNIKNNRFVYIRGNFATDSLYTFNDNQEDFILINNRTAKKADRSQHIKAMPFVDGSQQPFLAHGIPSILFDAPKRPYKIPLPDNSYYLIKKDTIRFFSPKNTKLFELPFVLESNQHFFTFGNTLFYLKSNGSYAIIENGKIRWTQLDMKPEADTQLYWNIVSQQVFLYSGEKLYDISYSSGKLVPKLIMENEDLRSNNIWCIYYDTKNSIIYLGSVKKGLAIYRMKSFTPISPGIQDNPELYEVFYALHPLTPSTVISASGIVMDNKKIIQNLHFNSDKYDINIDKDQNIWVSKFDVLYRYKKDRNYKNPDHWYIPDGVSAMLMDRDGTMWFDTSHNYEKSGSIYHFRPQENPVFIKYADTPYKINCFAEGSPGILWIGSKKGLHRLDTRTKKIQSITGTAGLKIRSIYISDHDNIWLTTYEKGFYLYRDNRLYAFPRDKNNYLTSAHCIVEDSKGFFWISANKGLFQVSKKSLLDYAAKKTKNIYYQYYDKDYGFLSNEFNGGCQPCGITLENGTIFFPSINGVVAFNPDKVRPILPDADIFIDEAMVDGKKKRVKDTIVLDRRCERVTFFISSPYYGNENNLNFEVKLNGPDEQGWSTLSKERNISFTKLRPGKYKLIVRKLSGFNSAFKYKTVTIIIEPAFWQTIWFRIFVLLILVMLIFITYNIRTNYIRNSNVLLQKKVNEQTFDLKNTIMTLRSTKDNLNRQIENNTKIIQYITHDIKSPLKFMAMASKYMYDSFEENSEDLKENIRAIYTSSSQMYNFVENLLEYSKVSPGHPEAENSAFDVSEIINDKIALFEGIALSQKTVIKNLVPQNTQLNKNRHLFSIIIHNLLDNAIKNTGQGSIVFSSSVLNGKMHIAIKDNGKGMNRSTLEHYKLLYENQFTKNKEQRGMGLAIVIELLLILNGKMLLESKENTGTNVTLIFDNA